MKRNADKAVIVVPLGALDSKAKERLTKAGYVYIETDKPSSVRLLSPEPTNLSANALAVAAVAAIRDAGISGTHAAFVSNVADALYARGGCDGRD